MTPKEAETEAANKPVKLTPYQGTRKCFGLFQCSQCDRQWSSGHSWANTSQACRNCNARVYPKQQRKLWRRKQQMSAVHDPSKAHATTLCQKCQSLGSSCVAFNRDDRTDGTSGNSEQSKIKKKKRRSKRKAC